MEVKTLLRLIKDDIAHLEGITGELFQESVPSSDEIELALVRSRTLLRELELLHKIATQYENSSKMVKISEGTKVELAVQDLSDQEPFELFERETYEDEREVFLITDLPDIVPAEEVTKDELHTPDQQYIEKFPEVQSDDEPVEKHFTALVEPAESGDIAQESLIGNEDEDDELIVAGIEAVIGVQEYPTEINELDTAVDQKVVDAAVFTIVQTEVVSDFPEYKEEILAEEFSEVKKTLNETLGEAHQMVNDILSPEKIESGYQVTPIDSIWDGIGINDRFLFIRELFANSSAKFENTVAALDKLDTIQEAVGYLKLNFKWNKTEASQKFLVLVKRRFTK